MAWLDNLNDPRNMGLLAAGLSLLTNRGNPGMGLLGGLEMMQQMQAQQQANQLRQQNFDMQKQQFDWQQADRERTLKAEQDRKDAMSRLLGGQDAYVRDQPIPMLPKIDNQAMTADLVKAGMGDELIKQRFIPKPSKVAFTPSGVAYDENNPASIQFGKNYSKPESAPSAVREYEYGLRNPGFNQWSIGQKRAGATNLNINQNQEKEENKAVGKYFGEQYADIQRAGLSSSAKINRINRLNQLLDGVNTGKFSPLGVEVASAAQSLGFNIDPKLGNKQAAEALANEMALEMRNPSGGAGMPGALSDKDREFLKQMVPGIEKTPEGRKLISDTAISLAKRDSEVAKMARDYRKRNGAIDEGFYEELSAYAEKNPMFSGKGVNPPTSGKAKFLGFEE